MSKPKKSQPKYDKVQTVTPIGKLSYPSLFEPQPGYEGRGLEYKTEIYFDKGDAAVEKLQADIQKVLKNYFGDRKIPTDVTLPLFLQDREISRLKENGKDNDNLVKGAYMFRAKTNAENGKPVVVDKDLNPILDKSEIYGGVKARVSVTLAVYEIKTGKYDADGKALNNTFVTAYLTGVQKMADSAKFGGGADVAALFGAAPVAPEFEELL
jgi:hypothetical protein